MSSLPALPRHKELMTRLAPLHGRLSCDKTAAKKYPVYKSNKWQVIFLALGPKNIFFKKKSKLFCEEVE